MSTDMQSLVINATDFVPSSDVAYNKPRVNKAGGKAVGIINSSTRRQLMISTPLMLTWGVNERVDESSGRVSYDMSLQFPKEGYTTPETTKFLDAMVDLEKQVCKDAIKNSKDWFNKSKLTDAQVEVLFNPMLYWPKDKETGDKREGAAPTLRVKLDYWDESFNCEVYNMDRQPLFPNASDPGITPSDLIAKGNNVACVLKCGGIYFVNGKFGVTWRLVQAVVKPRASIRGQCVINLSTGDRERLANQSEDLDENGEDNGVAVEDDSDDDEPKVVAKKEVKKELDDAASVTSTGSSGKKKVVKKKVVKKKIVKSED